MTLSSTTLPAQARPRMKTDSAQLLAQWIYIEYSAMRVLCGWGRGAEHWEDKLAMCYGTWLQAQNVDKLRDRLQMVPGDPDAPVAGAFETALNTLFLAGSWAEAMSGLHEILYPALAQAYSGYITASHPVHDHPTHDILRQIMTEREVQTKWYESFKARSGHQINPDYAARAREALSQIGDLREPLPAQEPFARPCGKFTDYRMQAAPGRVPEGDKAPNIMPFLELDWSHRVEARRLYFMIGYMWEMGVAEMQLRWLFYADFMPWKFLHDEARHMWDESRHGNSGRTRLQNFGLGIKDVGYNSYGAAKASGLLPPMSPSDVYEAFYGVTQIAETGYFKTKGYCFEDFRDGGDLASAEMMQFDIIDETSHTEYGRLWLEEMMKRAGIEEDYKTRALQERHDAYAKAGRKVELYRHFLETGDLPQDEQPGDASLEGEQPGDAVPAVSVVPGDSDSLIDFCRTLVDPEAKAHYQWLLDEVRRRRPLSNVNTAPVR